MEINILFLGGAKRVSLAERLIDAGKRLGTDVNIFSYELDEYVPIASIGTIIKGLRWNDANILSHLIKIIEDNKISILLPYVDHATIVAARLKEVYKKVFIPVSDSITCERFFNKKLADRWFREHQFPVPSDVSTFPLIAKPVAGSASIGIEKINNADEYEIFKRKNEESKFLIQQYIDGNEYTVDCFITQNKELICAVPRLRIEVTSGEVTKAQTVNDIEIKNLCCQIIATSDLKGPVNIQFIRSSKNGKLYIMEINPRFGGGIICSIEAGADIPLYILMEHMKLPLKPVENIKWGLMMMRANREFFSYADNN